MTSGRYRSLLIEGGGTGYLKSAGQELKRLGWREGELSQRPKNDPAKLALAARLRQETTLALPWIATRLKMGTWKSLHAKLPWRRTA